MKPVTSLSLLVITTLVFIATAQAHFGMVIPSTNIVDQQQREIELVLSFSHPFEKIGMNMEKPERFYMLSEGRQTDLLPHLKETQVMGHNGWQARQQIARPAVNQYIMEPVPYWEAAEDIFIIHYTKTYVAAYGADEGWGEPAGLPTEILPLLRPFGNYAGNIFTGKVLIDGEPAAGCEVEVEFYNKLGQVQAATDYHITQVIRTDENGVFNFSCPHAGWWGFSALHEADYTLAGPDGQEKAVELGGVLWVYFHKIQ